MRISVILAAILLIPFSLPESGMAGDKKSEKQQAKTFQTELVRKVQLNYLLYLPPGYEKEKDKKWPLMLFLHGAGESGSNLNNVKKHGPPKLAEKKDFPFILVSPQAPKFGWDVEALNALLDEIVKDYRVDTKRVYLTGLSMGGYGSWALAGQYPERFAAVAPICGGGNRIWARNLAKIPIWVFHGAKDSVVPLKESQQMVDAVKARGGNVQFTVYPNANHDSWTETYDNPRLFEWFLEQKRK